MKIIASAILTICWSTTVISLSTFAAEDATDCPATGSSPSEASEKGTAELDVEIPLKSIWALDMPGTKDVRKLDPRKDLAATAITRIGRAFIIQTQERAKAGPCFLVQGEGKVALKNAAKVLVGKVAPKKTMPNGKKVSLVFYSYAAPGYVQIKSIRCGDARVKIVFEIVAHRTLETTVHFALIPLGKLSEGQLAVEIEEAKPKVAYSNRALTERAVCDSCEITVEQAEKSKQMKQSGAREIPLKDIWAHTMPGTKNIHELERKSTGETTLMAVIGKALKNRENQVVGKGFAVGGTALTALENCFAVITKQKPRPKYLRAGQDVSVAFFTHYSNYYIHINKVVLEEHALSVTYEIIPHTTADRTLHFALIPLGKLESGDYKVGMTAKPIAERFIETGFKPVSDKQKAKLVSSSFNFKVLSEEKE